jgi:alpha-galactosidase
MKQTIKLISTLLLGSALGAAIASAKPLKVYIMAGQSNMQGHAEFQTLPYMKEDPETVPLHTKLVDKQGTPRIHEDVHLSLNTDYGTHQGPLTAGFGARKNTLGPELAFGVTMHEHLQEPILIIKTAWGGKSLHTDYRPPSAGPYVFDPKVLERVMQRDNATAEQVNAAKAAATGRFYKLMLEHVNTVLADPGRYHPAYDEDEGYELAGFVWFQGFNDLVDGHAYPKRGEPGSYDAYTEVLGHLIRDVRKALNTPQLPFVIGVIGVGGSYLDDSLPDARSTAYHSEFQKAMAAAADQPEFRGNVFTVHTGLYWDHLQGAAENKKWDVRREATDLIKEGKLGKQEQNAYEKKRLAELHTPQEAVAFKGISHKAFHYLGSAKILSRIGEAMAEALIQKKGNHNP